MSYQPLAVANEFIERYGKGGSVDHMKLQKLTYYTHGWWLAYEDQPVLTERPEVWKFGPVFGSMYRTLCPFGSRPITSAQKDHPFYDPPRVGDDSRVVGLIDWIWNRYGSLSSLKLSDMTHEEGTPWRILAEKYQYNVPRHFEIPDELIKSCFQQEARTLQPA